MQAAGPLQYHNRSAESGCSHATHAPEWHAGVGRQLAGNDGWWAPEVPLPSSDSSMTGIPILRTKSQSIGQGCDFHVATSIFFSLPAVSAQRLGSISAPHDSTMRPASDKRPTRNFLRHCPRQ
jgi:hypothetical protein